MTNTLKSRYEVYAEGKKIATVAKWRTAMNRVEEERSKGHHGSVIETFPYRVRPDLLVLQY